MSCPNCSTMCRKTETSRMVITETPLTSKMNRIENSEVKDKNVNFDYTGRQTCAIDPGLVVVIVVVVVVVVVVVEGTHTKTMQSIQVSSGYPVCTHGLAIATA